MMGFGLTSNFYPGHSMTIVGFEKQTNGKSNLLVFDPGYRDPSVVSNLVGKPFRHPPAKASGVLESYRRGNRYLRRFGEFEILWYAQINTAEKTDFAWKTNQILS